MKRGSIICLLGALSVAMGMASGDGCQSIGSGLAPTSPPIIVPIGNSQTSLTRTFRVDLRRHPQTRQITWDFGDGGVAAGLTVSAGQTMTHVFARAGTFDVTVHLFSEADPVTKSPPQLIGTGVLPVDVLGPNSSPIADFTVQNVLDSTGQPVAGARRLNAVSSRDPDGSIFSYAWDFGDGTTGEGVSTDHTFANSGRFVTRLTVTDNRGATGTITRTILVNFAPTAQFDFNITGASLLSVNFDASTSFDSDGVITSFRWNFGDNSVEATGATVSHTYAAPDDYVVTLTITDDFGQIVTTSRTVAIVGIEPFVRSADPPTGEIDSGSVSLILDGENFESNATAQLRRGATIVDSTAVSFVSAQSIRATFDLTGLPRGTYDVIVNNPVGGSATLTGGFRVISPDLVRLRTTLGDVVVQMVPDAPITTANFIQYVEDGFYNGTIFHRVVPGFVVQGGSFLPGNVSPGGIRPPIQNEFSPTRSNIRGTVAMAKLPSSPDSATAGFFFNLADNSSNLDNQNGGFTVFANVIEGLSVVDAMAAVPLTGEMPNTDIVITLAERE